MTLPQNTPQQEVIDAIEGVLAMVFTEREKERQAHTADYWRWSDVATSLQNAQNQLRAWT